MASKHTLRTSQLESGYMVSQVRERGKDTHVGRGWELDKAPRHAHCKVWASFAMRWLRGRSGDGGGAIATRSSSGPRVESKRGQGWTLGW